MGKHFGECISCGRGRGELGILLNDVYNECITCARLREIESRLSRLEWENENE